MKVGPLTMKEESNYNESNNSVMANMGYGKAPKTNEDVFVAMMQQFQLMDGRITELEEKYVKGEVKQHAKFDRIENQVSLLSSNNVPAQTANEIERRKILEYDLEQTTNLYKSMMTSSNEWMAYDRNSLFKQKRKTISTTPLGAIVYNTIGQHIEGVSELVGIDKTVITNFHRTKSFRKSFKKSPVKKGDWGTVVIMDGQQKKAARFGIIFDGDASSYTKHIAELYLVPHINKLKTELN